MIKLARLERNPWALVDDFFGEFGLGAPWNGGERSLVPASFTPRVDVSETDREIRVSVELPGMDEKDITVELQDASLTIRGEKKEKQEEKGKNWYWREQSYGSFHRVIPLPANVHGENAKAKFTKGVLAVTLPKRDEDQAKRKAIEIETD